MPLTQQGRAVAVAALASRREANKTRIHIDNSRLIAGSPMFFDCDACGGVIVEPEDYITRRRLCDECAALKECGWLE